MTTKDRARRFASSVARGAFARTATILGYLILRRAWRRYTLSAGHSGPEEAAPMRKVPTIAFRGSKGNKRAYAKGTSLDVWEIVEAYKYMGPERMIRESDLSKEEIDVAIGYYRKHPAEIDQRIEENRRSEDEWRKLYPDVFASQ